MSETEPRPRIKVGAGLAWSAFVILLMLGATLAVWNQFPADARLPIHWNAHGEIDRYTSKETALFFAPGIAALIAAIFAAAPFVEPRSSNLAMGRALYHTLWAGMLVIFAAVHGLIILSALGYPSALSTIFVPALGLFFAVVGNMLGKTRSNFIMGVRTPWTLSSEYAWEKTHRWLGRLWVLLGIAVLTSPLYLGIAGQAYLLVGGALSTAVAAIVLSYMFWRYDPSHQEESR